MTIAEQLMERGVEKGISQVALRLIHEGVPEEIVRRACSLSADEIKELRNK